MGILNQIATALSPQTRVLSEAVESLQNDVLLQEGQNIRLSETIADLQIALEDIGWLNTQWEAGQLEFSRQQLADIIRFSRLSFLKNPLINRGVNVQSLYVFGQGMEVRAEDDGDQAALDAFWNEPSNSAELTGHQAKYLKECDLQVTGNLFFVMFGDEQVLVRTIPVEEMTEIITNPEDRREVWYFKRQWVSEVVDLNTGRSRQEPNIWYYPALGYEPESRQEFIGGNAVKWDSPVFHVKVGGLSDMRFGVPETYQALDWARSYTRFLENCATLMKKLSKYAFTLEVKGGANAVASTKAKLGTSITGSNPIEQNPAPLVGSTFVSSQGAKLDPIKTSGVGVSPSDGRYFLLMVAASMGLPETFFGDADVGNHATSKTLDRPTELKFADRQQLWKHIIETIAGYAVSRSRRASGPMAIDTAQPPVKIDVTFPPILQHDVLTTVQAITTAANLGGYPKANTIPDGELSRLLLSALGCQGIDELLKQVEDQLATAKAEQEQQQQAQNDQAMALAKTKVPGPPGAKAQPGMKQAQEAIASFRATLAEMAKGKAA